MSNFETLWTVAHQAPLSMRILQSRILEGLLCPPPGDLPNPGIEPRTPALQVDSLLSEPPEKLPSPMSMSFKRKTYHPGKERSQVRSL